MAQAGTGKRSTIVYSLLNASALGFDIVRRPAAAQAAQALLAALTAPPVLLWELAALHSATRLPRLQQREAVAAAALMRGARAAAAEGGQPASTTNGTNSPARSTAGDLAEFTLGQPRHLDRLIGMDLLGGAPTAAAVPPHVHQLAADLMAEAAVQAWTADRHPGSQDACGLLQRALTTTGASIVLDLGLQTERIHAALAAVICIVVRPGRNSSPVNRPRVDPLAWASAMHHACRAIHLSGRERAAVGAQLMAAHQLAETDLNAVELAGWVWNTTSAVVAAALVDDLLDEDVKDVLNPTAHIDPPVKHCPVRTSPAPSSSVVRTPVRAGCEDDGSR